MQDREHRNDENLTREVERSAASSGHVDQIEAIRARVSDLESWGPRRPAAPSRLRTRRWKGKDENNGKGKKGGKEGNGNGNSNYNEDGDSRQSGKG
jgi:hypothetical protein